jgi:hypothetical protein
MPRKSSLNGRRPRPPGKVTGDVDRPLEGKQEAAGWSPTRNATADFPSQSLFRLKCEAIAMIRSGVSVATLITLATIGTASAQPIDLLAPPVAIPLPNDAPPMQPTVTYALLPGHWQPQGSQYLWVPPETKPRPVTYWRFVEGQYVWRGGEWVWVPAHYE